MRPNENGRNFRNTDLFYQSLEEPHGAIFCGEEMVGLDVNPQAYKEAHFATFPEKLVEPLIKAGSSEKGACPECGAPWERVVAKSGEVKSNNYANTKTSNVMQGGKSTTTLNAVPSQSKTIGWQPTCTCGKECAIPEKELDEDPTLLDDFEIEPYEPVPCIVLDPFAGSFTTKSVAQRLGRRGIGLELKWEYIQMGKKRCKSDQEDMFIPS